MQDVTINIKGETKKDMSFAGMTFGQRLQANLLETQQAETAGIALYMGLEAGLKDRTLEFFVNFVAQRFPTERSENYILTWATRLLSGTAWSQGDSESRNMLLQIAQEMKLENIPKDWVL